MPPTISTQSASIKSRCELGDYTYLLIRRHGKINAAIACDEFHIIDEYTRECLSLDVDRRLNSHDVLFRLSDLFVHRGSPAGIRSDNGAEFAAKAVRTWLERLRVRTLFIEPDSTWEDGYVESFNGKFRDELLNRELFYTLTEAQVLAER